jgi:hypothetical protein
MSSFDTGGEGPAAAGYRVYSRVALVVGSCRWANYEQLPVIYYGQLSAGLVMRSCLWANHEQLAACGLLWAAVCGASDEQLPVVYYGQLSAGLVMGSCLWAIMGSCLRR